MFENHRYIFEKDFMPYKGGKVIFYSVFRKSDNEMVGTIYDDGKLYYIGKNVEEFWDIVREFKEFERYDTFGFGK